MKKSLRHTVSIVALLIVSACAAGPNYETPQINSPPQFVSQQVLAALNEGKTQDALASAWWEGFEDSGLNALVEDGLAHNFEIAAALANVNATSAGINLAGAGNNLQIDADINAQAQERRELNQDQESTTNTSLGGALGLLLPLDIFGRTQRNVESARAQYDAANAALQGKALEVSSDISREYLLLRGNQRQLELLRESVALQEKTLSIVKSRFDAGLAPELDMRRAETSVENLRADIPPLEEDLLNSRNRLATLSGAFAGALEEQLKSHKAVPVYKNKIPDALPLDVLKSRPDVSEAEANLKRAIANIGVAEAEYYPSFSLSSQISIGRSGVSSLPTAETLIASIAALIQQAIFDGGTRNANLDIAKARADEALANYEQALRVASEDVETVLAAIDSSRKRQISLGKSVQSSTRSFQQAETLYQQGLISFLDVVDAQQSLASAEQQLAREKTNYATRIATLFQTLGVNVTL